MVAGFLSRRMGVLRSGDERVLSAYLYYFALPALFFVNVAEISFSSAILHYMFAGVVPIFIVLAIYILLYLLFKFQKRTLYLLILSTVFGSLAFFGIPFLTFTFGVEGERLAIILAVSIAMVSVPISLMVLELYSLERSTKWEGLKNLAKRLLKNPLILSILFGTLTSLVKIEIPSPASTALRMLGGTTSTVAMFMLGVFLYGRKYTNITQAFKLSLLRIIYLPVIALLTTRLFGIVNLESSALILMHGMPVAISMIVLSERYDFYKETIASLVFISSIGAIVYLNLWFFLLGN
jgi:predicted permease